MLSIYNNNEPAQSLNFRKKLSVVIPARNDGFMRNFNYRLETTLNYLGTNLFELGKLNQVEIIIADWGSEVPLYSVLSINDYAQAITKHLVVDYARAKELQGDCEFPIVMAQNAAIKRAAGEYIMQTDSDVLFTKQFLTKLFWLLDEKQVHVNIDRALVGSKRCHIPWQIIDKSPPINELENFIKLNGSTLKPDNDCGYGYCATGMMFMHRDMWNECSGYDEKLVHWGWMEIDLGLRVTTKYPWFDLSTELGMMIYHMEHYPITNDGRTTTRAKNPMSKVNIFRPNGDSWGFSNLKFDTFSYKE